MATDSDTSIELKRWRIRVVGALVMLLGDFARYLFIPAQIKVFEDILPSILLVALER